ncbi:uncharacterized protein LOC126894607 [Daktulosphaira vitifoliae]|uniref:uncharacterized protein LOC126894607 n=1 Tax=Daktulosphaira vitifoliae TaxID=58002 RepID=UPI0021AB0071|nr:uncharacterized protein LOC126894607 [Daktulosphaira vitifoliae]
MIEPVNSSSSNISISTDLSENEYETIIKSIKVEHFPLVLDESSDLEDGQENKKKNIHEPEEESKEHIVKKFKRTINNIEHTKLLRNNKLVGTNLSQPNNSYKNTSNDENENASINTEEQNNITSSMCIESRLDHKLLKSIPNLSCLLAHKCEDSCSSCEKSFAVYDNANHIGRVRNIEKQNSFLEIAPYLNIYSCLCDRCWKYLEKQYKIKQIEKRKGCDINSHNLNEDQKNNDAESSNLKSKKIEAKQFYLNIKSKKLKNYKKGRKSWMIMMCSVHNCSKNAKYPISAEKFRKIKYVFSMFDSCDIVLIECSKTKQSFKKYSKEPLSVCEEHLHLLDTLISCQLCGEFLNEDLTIDDWSMYDIWNKKLLTDQLPLKLVPGMFICVKCRCYILEDTSYIDLGILKQYIKIRENERFKLFGSYNTSNEETENSCKKLVTVNSTNNTISNFSKVTFTEPVITSTILFEPESNGFNETLGKINEKYTEQLKDLLPDPSNFNKFTDLKNISYTVLNEPCLKKNKVEIDYEDHILDIGDTSCKMEICNAKNDNLVVSNVISLNNSSVFPNSVSPTNKMSNELEVHNSRPNGRIIKMMNLLKNKVNSKFHTKLPIHMESMNSNDKLSELNNMTSENMLDSNNVISSDIDVDGDNDILPLHVRSLLDKDENLSNNQEENNKLDLVITSVYSQKNELKKNVDIINPKNQCIHHEENSSSKSSDTKIINPPLENTSPITKPINKANSGEIRIKLKNLVHQRISQNNNIKRLNNTSLSSNISKITDNNLSDSFNLKNNCYSQKLTKNAVKFSFKKTLVPSFLNDYSCSSYTPSSVNEFFESEEYLNDESDSVSSDTTQAYTSHNNEDINFKKVSYSDKLSNAEVGFPLKSLNFKRNLKKISNFCPPINQNYKQQLHENFWSDDKIVSHKEDSLIEEYYLDPESEFSSIVPLKVISRKFDFPQNSKIETTLIEHKKSEIINNDQDNPKKEIHFSLNKVNEEIFNQLLNRFNNETDVFRYLMENERMLYAKELIVSKNADPKVANYINNHLKFLKKWLHDSSNREDHPQKCQIAIKRTEQQISLPYNQSSNCKAIRFLPSTSPSDNVTTRPSEIRRTLVTSNSVPIIVATTQPTFTRPLSQKFNKSTTSLSKFNTFRPILPSTTPRPVAIRSGTPFVINRPLAIQQCPNFNNQMVKNILHLGNGRKYMIVKKTNI